MPDKTYYFNEYDIGGEEWDTNPENMVDGEILSEASATETTIQLLTSNTCPGTNFGFISKVELRLHGTYAPVFGTLLTRPIFTAGDGDNNGVPEFIATWSEYIDITTNSNAPPSWTWEDVKNLKCDIDYTFGLFQAACGKVEIRVTYSETPPANPYPIGRLRKDVISGYHCFLGAYVNAKQDGYDPLKLPDGTVF